MKIYRLYLTDSIEALVNEELIYEGASLEAVIMQAHSELVARGYNKTPYWRYLCPPEGIFIDFGSWSKFLFIENATIDEVMNT